MTEQPEYVVGLDLGQAQDYSALSVVERVSRFSPLADPEIHSKTDYLSVRYLKRWPLATPYTDIVKDVAALLFRPPLPGCRLAVDATGVGRAVVDLFRLQDLRAQLVPITITAGNNVTPLNGGYSVAKKHLAGTLQVLFQQQRLKISDCPERETLVKELRAFRLKVSQTTGNETFEAWRERDHDDLVLSIAVACWLMERGGIHRGPLLRILPFRNRKPEGPSLLVLTSKELATTVIDEKALLVSIQDPELGEAANGTPMQTRLPDSEEFTQPGLPGLHQQVPGESPTHGCNKLLGSLVLWFADLNPAELQERWEDPIQPWGKPPAELVMKPDHAKKLWGFLNRKFRGANPEVIIFHSPHGRRALSAAVGWCESYRIPLTRIGKGPDSLYYNKETDVLNKHVVDQIKLGRSLVV